MTIYFVRIVHRVEFRSIFRAPSQKFKILAIPDVLAHDKSYELGFAKKPDGHKHCAKSCVESRVYRFFVHRLGNSKYWPFPIVEFRSVFHAPSQKFKILAIPNVIAHGKSYKHGFVKKCDGHKHSTSRVSIGFSCTISKIQNTGHSQRNSTHMSRVSIDFLCTVPKMENIGHSDVLARGIVKFRSVFRAPFRKFKILAIPDVLAHGKSYEHGFKTRRSYTLREVTRRFEFRSVFRAPSRKFKILVIPDILAHGGESAISGVEGRWLFSPKRGTNSR
ncbi:hypothetical protein B296_00042776, partial [Ensete ventricosum]